MPEADSCRAIGREGIFCEAECFAATELFTSFPGRPAPTAEERRQDWTEH